MCRGGTGAHVSEGVSGHLKLAGYRPVCCHQLSLNYWPSSTHYMTSVSQLTDIVSRWTWLGQTAQTQTDRDHSTPGYFNQFSFSFSVISFIIPMELGRHKDNFLFEKFRYWKILPFAIRHLV